MHIKIPPRTAYQTSFLSLYSPSSDLLHMFESLKQGRFPCFAQNSK